MHHVMQEEDYKYTWSLPQNAWYIRLYLWMYQASAEDITFCKLWWASVFFVPFLVPRIVIGVTGALIRTCQRVRNAMRLKRRERRELAAAATQTELRAKAEKPVKMPEIYRRTTRPVAGRQCKVSLDMRDMAGNLRWVRNWYIDGVAVDYTGGGRHAVLAFQTPGRHKVEVEAYRWGDDDPIRYTEWITVHERPFLMLRAIEKVANGATWVIMHASPIFKALATVRRYLKWPLRIFAVFGLLTGSGFGIYSLVNASWLPGVLSTIGGIVATGWPYIAAAVGIAIIGVAFIMLLVVTGFIAAAQTVILKPFAGRTKKSALGFRKMMKIGYVSVKSNTCPRVVVEEDE